MPASSKLTAWAYVATYIRRSCAYIMIQEIAEPIPTHYCHDEGQLIYVHRSQTKHHQRAKLVYYVLGMYRARRALPLRLNKNQTRYNLQTYRQRSTASKEKIRVFSLQTCAKYTLRNNPKNTRQTTDGGNQLLI